MGVEYIEWVKGKSKYIIIIYIPHSMYWNNMSCVFDVKFVLQVAANMKEQHTKNCSRSAIAIDPSVASY